MSVTCTFWVAAALITKDCFKVRDATGIPKLLKAKEAAELLAISPRKLWELTNRGDIPCVKMGPKVVRYDVDDLCAAIKKFKRR